MLFRPEHIEQIRSGEKTVTRRDWKSPQATEGGVYIASTEMFTSHDEADCYIRVNQVSEEPLGAITPAQADREGGYTVEEFEQVWREINGEYDPAKRVTVVEFEYVGRSHPDKDESQQTEILTDGGVSDGVPDAGAGEEVVDGDLYEYPFRVEDFHGEVIRDDLDTIPPFLNQMEIDILASELEECFKDGIDGQREQILVEVLRKLPDSEYGRDALPAWIVRSSDEAVLR